MSGQIAGKNVIITGASRGLGSHIAGAMWREGASLLLIARTRSALVDLERELEAAIPEDQRQGQKIAIAAVDLGQPDAVDHIMAAAIALDGRIDVLVNNAAIQGPIGPLTDSDPVEWARTIAVDLIAPVMLCRACIPLMGSHSRGKIINLSGGGATGPRANFSAYASAKAGLVRFSETLAQEVPHIDVNCVAPGVMGSQMLETVLKAGAERAGAREVEIAQKALAQEASANGNDTVERAAGLCVFLASSASDGITGKLISAVWDPWSTLPQRLDDLRSTDIYTLRRIVPEDRNLKWGDS